MKTIKEPESKLQPRLFSDENLGWWVSRLSPNALNNLERGWQGVFRRSILQLMPAEQLGEHFSDTAGRPTKELYSMAGLMLIAEFKNLTGEQTAEAYTFDASIQYALNLPCDGQYLSARTVDNYRKLFREDEAAQDVFTRVSATLVAELELDISRQRLDSTHVLSNMARLGRQQLLAVGVKRFLVQLRKHHRGCYDGLPEELRERYLPAESRLFGQGTKKALPKDEAIEQTGQDMALFITRFGEDESVAKMKSYADMARLFAEHFKAPQDKDKDRDKDKEEASGQRPELRPKSKDAEGGSTRTLQNPSDPDAGYDGHKGAGYQAQIAQTLPPRDEKDRIEGPGLLTGLLPQSAAVRDDAALAPMLEQQRQSGLRPGELTADTLYGSDANVQSCAEQGIELVSPVGGKPPGLEEPKHNCTRAEKEKKQRLAQRREEQETEAWTSTYATRGGIEGVNRALDAVTGFKRLRVRGIKAVSMALYLKAAGWNILSAAKILARRARKAPPALLSATKELIRRILSPENAPPPSASYGLSLLLPQKLSPNLG